MEKEILLNYLIAFEQTAIILFLQLINLKKGDSDINRINYDLFLSVLTVKEFQKLCLEEYNEDIENVAKEFEIIEEYIELRGMKILNMEIDATAEIRKKILSKLHEELPPDYINKKR